MAAGLTLRLLGGLQVALHGVPLTDFVSAKAPALLAYLAVTSRPHRRETLAALLWGEHADADAKNNLRQALSSLRRPLAPFLLITRETAALNPEADVFLDTQAFETALLAGADDLPAEARAARLQEAAALYQGDFLAGVAVRDAPEFEDWLLAQRSRFRELALHALHTVTEWHMRRGQAVNAIDTATRLLGIEAWREEAHRQLMLALARSGQRSAALAQYEAGRRILEKELGVAPSAETTALYERIRTAKRQVLLPPAPTPFVGRAEELAQVARLLADPAGRLITLLGPGGCGKTRLAREAAARAADAFLHGVGFVPLAGTSALDVVPSAIAEALGVALSGQADPREQLLAYLRDKELLLVLDNLEHLAGADAWVGGLAEACPEVRLLVTSRERLNLYGEQLVEVSGLDLPAGMEDSRLAGCGAAQLFHNSAAAARPGFIIDAENAPAVARICRLVDGLPLALELAAAWVRQLSCREIADEIERNLGFLATTRKNVPARHRSLPAAFEHSWSLLTAAERRAFARLAVFRGGCEREAALAVAECPLPVLAALGDKSLLRRDPAGRYSLHELLRQYAEDKLRQLPGEWAEAQARHCAYYVGLIGAREDALNDARQAQARREIAVEMDNVRAAWGWAVTHQQVGGLQPALEGLRVFLEHAGWYAEAVGLFAAAAAAERASAGADSVLYGQLLARQAWFHHRRDQFEAARPLVQDSLRIFQTGPAALPAETALCWQCLANMARAVGDFAQAIEYSRQSLALHRAGGNPRLIAAALNTVGVAHTERGEFAEAQQLHTEGLALRRELGDRRGVAVALVNLGNVALAQGRYAEAKPFEREALAIFREIGYPMGEAVALNNLGAVGHMLGEYTEAHALLQECLSLCQDLGHRHIAAHTLGSLGGVAGALGDYRAAWRHTQAALQTAREIGSLSATLFGLVSAAVLLARQEEHERAVEVAALVGHHAAANRETKDRAQHLLAQLETQVPAPLLAAARDRGQAQDVEALAANILEWARARLDLDQTSG
ncbi:MAG: tetratricopeptide repeat protein [Anaerolineales bacterium]|nr:tetratricopeptide repeat protein [Anaerolineales bacterium]